MKGKGMDTVREALAELDFACEWLEKEAADLLVCDFPKREANARRSLAAVRAAREALSVQPAAQPASPTLHGESGGDARMSAPYCCEASWSEAKQLAWKERDLHCGCDHNEYCEKCWPVDFRHGGKWSKYAPQPPAKGGAA